MYTRFQLKKLFLWFTLYSFIGWVLEICFRSLLVGEIVFPGFLGIPICPIYGFVALLFIILLDRFRDKWYLVFIFGALISGVFEYITSFLLEFMFHAVWWDYSQHYMNINGRTCLDAMLMFGVLAVFLVKVLHPFIENITDKYLSSNVIIVIDIVLLIIILTSLFISVYRMLVFNEYSPGAEINETITIYGGLIL